MFTFKKALVWFLVSSVGAKGSVNIEELKQRNTFKACYSLTAENSLPHKTEPAHHRTVAVTVCFLGTSSAFSSDFHHFFLLFLSVMILAQMTGLIAHFFHLPSYAKFLITAAPPAPASI